MKKMALLGGLALATTVFGDGSMVATAQKMNGGTSAAAASGKPMDVVTLTSARPESDNGWYLFADVLYWHADVGRADWAVKIPNGFGTGATVTHAENRVLDFKWSWGFKAGIGVNMDHDMWDSNLYYTWFKTRNSNRAGVNSSSGYATDTLGGFGTFTSGKADWKVFFSMFDWELGRWYYVSPRLSLRPHVGLKGGWIHQDVHTHLTNGLADTALLSAHSHAHYKNHFWGVGPSVGLNSLWELGSVGKQLDHRFCIFGDFGGALMYGHFDVRHDEHFTDIQGAPSGGLHVGDLSRNLAVTMLQGFMGLSWDTPFNHARNHFMFKVGYEFQYWFRQNQLATYSTLTNTFQRLSDDLSLQGITGELRFDF